MTDNDKIINLYEKGILTPNPIADGGPPETWNFVDLETGEIFPFGDSDHRDGRFYFRVTKFNNKWHLVDTTGY